MRNGQVCFSLSWLLGWAAITVLSSSISSFWWKAQTRMQYFDFRIAPFILVRYLREKNWCFYYFIILGLDLSAPLLQSCSQTGICSFKEVWEAFLHLWSDEISPANSVRQTGMGSLCASLVWSCLNCLIFISAPASHSLRSHLFLLYGFQNFTHHRLFISVRIWETGAVWPHRWHQVYERRLALNLRFHLRQRVKVKRIDERQADVLLAWFNWF